MDAFTVRYLHGLVYALSCLEILVILRFLFILIVAPTASEDKTRQMMGATLVSYGPNQDIVVSVTFISP